MFSQKTEPNLIFESNSSVIFKIIDLFDTLTGRQLFPVPSAVAAQLCQRSHLPPKFLKHIVILCFKRRFPKQNSVIHLKANILAPRIFYPPKYLGWLHHYNQVLRFGRAKYIFRMERFLFLSHVQNKFFWAQENLEEHKNDLGVTAPNSPPCLRAWADPSPEGLPFGVFMFVHWG